MISVFCFWPLLFPLWWSYFVTVAMLTAPLTIFVCFHYHYHKKSFYNICTAKRMLSNLVLLYCIFNQTGFHFFIFCFRFGDRCLMSDIWCSMMIDQVASHRKLCTRHVHKVWVVDLVYYYFSYLRDFVLHILL